ncbi:MAG: ThuA domain-containing protein [Phycisphaerales bacterium]|nr:ThuA domain-containing protein [Phycisphaerales bacterium]
MGKKALIVRGGWDGHQPREVSEIFDRVLREEGFETEVSDTLDALKDQDKLNGLSLIVPVWTMGTITAEQSKPVFKAVNEAGVGIAGCHGGMCDSFRENTEWQFMTGGQWVAHPGDDGVTYRVRLIKGSHPIVQGIEDFDVCSEQYYMHTDPSNHVLATTEFPLAAGPHTPNGRFDMPVVWTRFYGKGRVFYTSLGHQANIVASEPCLTIIRRGFNWAAK